MIAQCMVYNEQAILAGVIHFPPNKQPRGGVLLTAGFSQAMCDMDYFMSKLARRLLELDLFILQIDPRGHGDSSGLLEEITLNALQCDLQVAMGFIRDRVQGKIIAIGRGINLPLLAGMKEKNRPDALGGISPYCIHPESIHKIWEEIPGDSLMEIASYVPGRDYLHGKDFDRDKMAFFNALGGEMANLHGQKLNPAFLRDLTVFDPYLQFAKYEGDTCWLVPNGKDVLPWNPTPGAPYLPIATYFNNSLPRDPMWQHMAIEQIFHWSVGVIGQES